MIYLLFCFLGIFFGIMFSILFIRMDKGWKKLTCLFGSNTGFIAFFMTIWYTLDIQNNMNNHNTKINLFTIYFITIIISMLITFFYICSKLKNQESAFKITFLDIIWGYNKIFDIYYENKQKEINKYLKYDELLKMKDDLDKREDLIKEKENNLAELKRAIDNAIKEHPYIILPKDNKIPIENNGFIKQLPNYINNLSCFVQHLTQFAYDFVESKEIENKEQSTILKGYFYALCVYTTKYLFESNNDNVRTHIRILNKNSYEGLVACIGTNLYDKRLTSINKDNGMIFEAGKIKRSLIKSINNSYHLRTKNDEFWEDYITLVFNNFYENDIPIISMGISVNNEEKYKNLLYFINYCKIERIIEKNMEIINEKYDIINMIKEFRKGA